MTTSIDEPKAEEPKPRTRTKVEFKSNLEPWVDADAVAAHLGFKSDHVRKLAGQGKLPGVQLANGKRKYWRFKLSHIDQAMAEQTNCVTISGGAMSAIVDMAVRA